MGRKIATNKKLHFLLIFLGGPMGPIQPLWAVLLKESVTDLSAARSPTSPAFTSLAPDLWPKKRSV